MGFFHNIFRRIRVNDYVVSLYDKSISNKKAGSVAKVIKIDKGIPFLINETLLVKYQDGELGRWRRNELKKISKMRAFIEMLFYD